ncbi:hypothetical protein NUSPORA_01543 [Nucleospora cyclopteri]
MNFIYKCKVEIKLRVLTWDGVITKYHNLYVKKLSIPPKIEAYIQTIVIQKTLESISLDFRRGHHEVETGSNTAE